MTECAQIILKAEKQTGLTGLVMLGDQLTILYKPFFSGCFSLFMTQCYAIRNYACNVNTFLTAGQSQCVFVYIQLLDRQFFFFSNLSTNACFLFKHRPVKLDCLYLFLTEQKMHDKLS